MMTGFDQGIRPGQSPGQMQAPKAPVSPALYPAAQPPASLDKSGSGSPGSTGPVAVNPALTKLTAPTVPPPRQLTPEQMATIQPQPASLTVDTTSPGPIEVMDFRNGPQMTTSPVGPHDRAMAPLQPSFPDQYLEIRDAADQQRNAVAAAMGQAGGSATAARPAAAPIAMPTAIPPAPVAQPPVVMPASLPVQPSIPAPVAAPALTAPPIQPPPRQMQAPRIGGGDIQHLLRRYRQGNGAPVIGGRRISGMM